MVVTKERSQLVVTLGRQDIADLKQERCSAAHYGWDGDIVIGSKIAVDEKHCKCWLSLGVPTIITQHVKDVIALYCLGGRRPCCVSEMLSSADIWGKAALLEWLHENPERSTAFTSCLPFFTPVAAWDRLLGRLLYQEEIKWRRPQADLVQLFDEGSSTMAKVKKAAKGVVFELANDRALVMEGPEEKVDHLVSFLQQLIVKEGHPESNYIIVKVVGSTAEPKLDHLQQHIGNAGKTVPVPWLHFSVAHTIGAWPAEQASILAEELDQQLRQSPPSPTTKDTFVCDKVAFFDPKFPQVLGVAPSVANRPINNLFGMLQGPMPGENGLKMETTQGKYQDVDKVQANNQALTSAIKKLPASHDFLGPMKVESIVVSRRVKSLEKRIYSRLPTYKTSSYESLFRYTTALCMVLP
ncbi:hypothetical protein O0I10_008823 [Lichtheimia ornata]|uniref:Uncharacterized protein n=1 Tax=Lichtheimia ornata TaxID=688661 RepID=A0AAD7XZ99_9FUNG|nr:uncharacterized protein O0I10_008823 [Lichtheimia ornata]KAJ8655537.1 hypothetical protein O0I10_008823 [Lichtheimia ornata]